MSYQPKDYYYHKAKRDHFVARSVYKLKEMDRRHHLFHKGQLILDLGAFPGSWSQYIASRVGPHGKVFGIDLQPISLSLPNCYFVQADLLRTPIDTILENLPISRPVDGVVSDMAPKTTGIISSDQARSLELCELAVEIAKKCLKTKGFFVCKLFQQGESRHFHEKLRLHFRDVQFFKPKSTRTASKEIFLLARQYKKKPILAWPCKK